MKQGDAVGGILKKDDGKKVDICCNLKRYNSFFVLLLYFLSSTLHDPAVYCFYCGVRAVVGKEGMTEQPNKLEMISKAKSIKLRPNY